jgi:hypothetical protein
MHFAVARREDHGVQALPDEPQHLKSPLSIRFAGVFLHQRSGPFHLLDELKRQTTARYVGGVLVAFLARSNPMSAILLYAH